MCVRTGELRGDLGAALGAVVEDLLQRLAAVALRDHAARRLEEVLHVRGDAGGGAVERVEIARAEQALGVGDDADEQVVGGRRAGGERARELDHYRIERQGRGGDGSGGAGGAGGGLRAEPETLAVAGGGGDAADALLLAVI